MQLVCVCVDYLASSPYSKILIQGLKLTKD